MFTDGNAPDGKTDGGPISKGMGQQSSLGKHTQKGETGKFHLLNQKDLDDTFNLTAPMESIWCKTPAFHLLLKFSLKGTVPTPNLLGIHFYYS